jgi:hypothetical protein
MKTLRHSAHRYLRLAPPLSLRSVAAELAVPPRSARALLDRLDQHKRTVSSGSLLPSSVKATATLTLCSDGMWEFSGHVHDNGFIGHTYALVAAPLFVDGDGRALAFSNEGEVTDRKDDDFAQSGWDDRISRHWDQLARVPVEFALKVDSNLDNILGKVAATLGAIAVILFSADQAGFIRSRKVDNGDGTHHYERPDPP